MPSVVGLLEERELTARRRVDTLGEEADRIQAELVRGRAGVERVGHRPFTRRRGAVPGRRRQPRAPPRSRPGLPASSEAAKLKSVVPVWRAGLAQSALSADYQRIVQALADRSRLGQGPLTCQEMAACFGLDPVPAKVEALRAKAKRLTARGWLAEPTPGRFTLGKAVAGPGGGS